MKPSEVSNPVLSHGAATSFDVSLPLPQWKGKLQGLLPALLFRRNQLKPKLLQYARHITILPLFDRFAVHISSYGASFKC